MRKTYSRDVIFREGIITQVLGDADVIQMLDKIKELKLHLSKRKVNFCLTSMVTLPHALNATVSITGYQIAPIKVIHKETNETYHQEEYLMVEDNLQQVTLFQSDYDEPNKLKSLVAQSFNAAVLDCGASKTVCGTVWLNCYLESLNETEQKKVKYKKSNNLFKFGDGSCISSLHQVTFPATIGKCHILIVSDVVNNDIPLLLSKQSMKRANMRLNFNDDMANILGQKINLVVTNS